MKPPVLPPLQQNILDKAIAYLAPKLAVHRMQARGALAIAGGYTGARVDRAALSAWRTSAGSPHSDVIVDLPMLRQRSADLERNAPIAASVINTSATHVVGTGITCNPQIDAEYLGLTEQQATEWQNSTKRRFKAWAESPDCDLARVLNFYGIQDLALRGTLGRGDMFVVTPRIARTGKRPKLALQLIEADLVCNPERKQDTDTLTDGIEHSAATGEALAVHISSRHPGDVSTQARTWTRVPVRGDQSGRRNVLHLFRQLRPGLRRGVPVLAPIIEPIKQFTTYTSAELQAAVTSGLFSVFVKMDPTAFGDLFDEDAQNLIVGKSSSWSGEIEAGKAVNLLPGESIETSNPGRPNAQFDAFTTSCMRQIGMAIGIPYEVLVMHYQSSYSAARGALLMAWRFFMGWRDWLASNLCQPVYELWLADEIANGDIAAPGFFADDVVRHAWCSAQWVGDGPGSIDPGKEVAAAKERVALGISTLQAESIAYDGVDWETKHRQAIKEAEAREAAGMPPPGQDAVAPVPAPPVPEPPTEEVIAYDEHGRMASINRVPLTVVS
jgi:lambda family phage portal protein